MTLLNYTDFVPTPVPVTTGTTVQSYTDPTGEVWVAKNGVRGGNWYKARDVLYGRVYRSTAYTYPTAAANMPFNAVSSDVYGMWVTASNQFTVPIAGLYQYNAQLVIAFTAAGQYLAMQTTGIRSNTYGVVAGNAYGQVNDTDPLAAAQGVGLTAYSGTASLIVPAAGLTASDGFFTIKYVGTG